MVPIHAPLPGPHRNAQVKFQAEVLSKAVVERILNDETTMDLVVQLVVKVVQQPETIEAAKQLVKELFEDPKMLEATKLFFMDLLDEPEVQVCHSPLRWG